MTESIHWLHHHSLVSDYDVLDFYDFDGAAHLKLRIVLTDGSLLFTKEYTDEVKHSYAYHWQTADAIWLMRWDNVPHFPKLASFPHHKHDYRGGAEVVVESYSVTLSDVLEFIATELQLPQP
ncbi:toxin-antitoxin system TumE family protein [Spirosoma montaniterrae]|uniref:Uncharacterized protein n=1 Tax=Spirosoma montaniterrae TaxID=1178516 RepID=A0A1P9WRR1_9BACT|nr:DUF6516 family protein [Spirosoma montaniterrae]AQG78066.1 hypothetical protein AWR27_01085 [Spirosoma montaniterrae]